MSVISPHATASVRGTTYYFDTRTLSVSEGTVHFRGNRSYTFQISAGSSGSVGRKGAVTAFNQNTAENQPLNPVGFDTAAGATGAPGSGSGLGPGTGPGSDPGSGPGIWPGPGSSGGPGTGDVGVQYPSS
jgi:hypothetical protein